MCPCSLHQVYYQDQCQCCRTSHHLSTLKINTNQILAQVICNRRGNLREILCLCFRDFPFFCVNHVASNSHHSVTKGSVTEKERMGKRERDRERESSLTTDPYRSHKRERERGEGEREGGRVKELPYNVITLCPLRKHNQTTHSTIENSKQTKLN